MYFTCIHVYFTCIHVYNVKYTCYTSGNGLAMLAILENPNFDPSHNSVASEIFLSLILKNDPCLKNGTLKLFLGNFWPRNKYYPQIHIRVDRNCQPTWVTQNAIPEEQELILLWGIIMTHLPPDKVWLIVNITCTK